MVKLADGSLLNRYWDNRDTPRQVLPGGPGDRRARPQRPAGEVYRDLRAGAESGWDFSSRWLDDGRELASIRTTAIVPVDLNALLYHLERTIAKACASSALKACEQGYGARAEKRRQAIEDHLWHPAGYYADYDWQRRRPIERINAASPSRYSPGWPPPNAPVVPPTASPPNCCARADWPPPPVPAASNGTSRTAGHPCSGSPYRACAPTAGTPWRKTSAAIPRPGAAGLRPRRKAGGEIRHQRQPGRRRWRVPAAGRLRLVQRRDPATAPTLRPGRRSLSPQPGSGTGAARRRRSLRRESRSARGPKATARAAREHCHHHAFHRRPLRQHPHQPALGQVATDHAERQAADPDALQHRLAQGAGSSLSSCGRRLRAALLPSAPTSRRLPSRRERSQPT